MFRGRRILVGVCGGIAAYKVPELVRTYLREGAEVRVAMTSAAEAFVTPLLFEAVSGSKVFTQRDFLSPLGGTIPHTELGLWAEAIVVVPATAAFLARLRNGDASELLVASIMASRAKVLLVPAMNANMWIHPATQQNIEKLQEFGYRILPPEEGRLACGIEGPGRLPSTEVVLLETARLLNEGPFSSKRVLVTGGPTREYIDSVRFVSNPSSGKMAFRLAEAFYALGAEVELVCGPTAEAPPGVVSVTRVETSEEMFKAVEERFGRADVAVFAAAVCDIRPKTSFQGKLKKESIPEVLRLELTKDIAETFCRKKKDSQKVVIFALEEKERLEESAVEKLRRKGADFVVANDLSAFESDATEVVLISRGGAKRYLKGSKREVAFEIAKEVSGELTG